MTNAPVYLAGIERSGTSLMYALLASHPKIAMTRRTNLWTYFYGRYGDLSDHDNFERCLAMMMRYKRLRVLQPDPDRIRQEFRQGEPTYARLFTLLEEHYAERLGKPRWGDKSLNTERYIDPIFAAFPGAKVIHMIRDPRDRYASARSRWKQMKGKAGVGTAMWLMSVDLARKNQHRYPEHYKVVPYEMLTSQPEETLHEVCTFIGEEYAPEMLSMEGAPRLLEKGSNSSYGRREAGVISTDSIARYRKVLTVSEIAFIQSKAGNEMLAFGYPLDPIEFSFQERLAYLFLHWPINRLRMAVWNAKEMALNLKGRDLPSRRLVANETSRIQV
jgi:hypothetical protein